MTHTKCDLCGELIEGPVSKIGIIVKDPGAQRRSRPGQSLMEAFGLQALPAEVEEFDGCLACMLAILIEFKRRKKMIKQFGRVVRE